MLFIPYSYAFLSPSTLQLLVNSVGNVIYQFLIIAFGILIAFFLRLKKWVFILFGIILLILIFIVINKFVLLKEVNTFSPSYYFGDLPDSELFNLISNITIEYMDPNEITNQNYKDYIFIDATHSFMSKIKTIPNMISLNFNLLDSYLNGTLDFDLKVFNLSKESDIIVVCSSGGTSKLYASILKLYGYNNIHFSKLIDAPSTSFFYKILLDNTLNADIKFNSININAINDSSYFILDYVDNTDHLHNVKSLSLVSNKQNVWTYNIWLLNNNTILNYDELFLISDEKKFLCSFKVACLRTYNFLESNNVSNYKIYLVDM